MMVGEVWESKTEDIRVIIQSFDQTHVELLLENNKNNFDNYVTHLLNFDNATETAKRMTTRLIEKSWEMRKEYFLEKYEKVYQ